MNPQPLIEPWRVDAECQYRPQHDWFNRHQQKETIRICRQACPVQHECHRDTHQNIPPRPPTAYDFGGIWAGYRLNHYRTHKCHDTYTAKKKRHTDG